MTRYLKLLWLLISSLFCAIAGWMLATMKSKVGKWWVPLFSNILLGLHFLDRFLGVVVVAAYCSLTLAANNKRRR